MMRRRTIEPKVSHRSETTATTVLPDAVWTSLTVPQQDVVRKKLVQTCQQLLRPGVRHEHG